tara:strand:+ start:3168 stop:4991 length:1824 start_codon:yes stop_codon:yes gene_type:complete
MSYGVYDNKFWWQADSEPADQISSFISVLREEQESFYSEAATHSGLYNGQPVSYKGYIASTGYAMMRQPRLTFNIIHSICQAATAKIAKHKPAISFLTEGGDFSQKKKAKNFNKFIQGQFYSLDIYPLAQKCFLDSCITGTGILKVFSEFGKVKIERVPLHEITIDHYESEFGSMPRQMFQTKKVSKHVLAEMFPDKREEILMEVIESQNDSYSDNTRDNDMVFCHEAWHLPSGPEAKDGRHVICTENVTLYDGEYEKHHFPFVFVRWTEDPNSFWGNGLAKEVKGIQVEINKLLARIQEQMHLATPKVFIEDTSRIVQSHLNNRVWGAIKYRGSPPQFFVPRAVSGEMFAHLDRLVARAYEMTGISQLSAQSKKPAGLESGRALREFSDIESERFMVVGQSYESLFIKTAEKIIDLVRDLHSPGSPYTSMSFDSKSGLDKISWGDVDLDEDQYVMQIKPIGSLPQTPAAKLASVTEMTQNGLFTKEEAHRLLDFPDLERANKLKNAHIEVLDMAIEEMVENGNFVSPEPYMNLEYGIVRFQQAYNLAILNQVPEERLELLRRWISQAEALIQMAQPPQPMPGAAPMGGAPGSPALPPGMPPGGLPI